MRLFYTRPSYTRPIVSGSASVTENIAAYVQYYVNSENMVLVIAIIGAEAIRDNKQH